ncbi:MAG: ERCC4 domain-containing protein [Peptostreptococcaceae bacterium]
MSKIDCKVLVDTRDKVFEHITSVFDKKNIKWERKTVKTGDYEIVDLETGLKPNIVIERKANLNELIANLLDKRDSNGHTRLHRELLRALESNTKVIILIEEVNWYEKLIKGDYISKVNKASAKGMLMSLEAKFPNVMIKGIEKHNAASYIYTTLYYHLREELK